MKEKSTENTMHEYTSTKVDARKNFWRWSNFVVLGVLVFIQKRIGVEFSDAIYVLVVGAILGVDFVPLLEQISKFFKTRS